MKFILNAYNIYELGARSNQEDALYPEYGKIKDTDRLFIVCDGMGGHSAGEIASNTVCSAMSESVLSYSSDPEGVFSDDIFMKALDDAYNALDAKDDGAEKKMGTTMTFLKLHEQGATIAHIGDSRVYHIRPGKAIDDTEILFQTSDHSLVNELVKLGEMTPEEAKTSRQKNIITRAMQPGTENRHRADLYHTNDIKAGDYFLLCSDGVLEQMEDDNIKFIFSEKGGDDNNKVDMMVKVTEHNKDNHSAIIVHITDVIDIPSSTVELAQTEETDKSDNYAESNKDDKCNFFSRHRLSIFIAIVVTIIFILASIFFFDKKDNDNTKQEEKIENVNEPRAMSKKAHNSQQKLWR